MMKRLSEFFVSIHRVRKQNEMNFYFQVDQIVKSKRRRVEAKRRLVCLFVYLNVSIRKTIFFQNVKVKSNEFKAKRK